MWYYSSVEGFCALQATGYMRSPAAVPSAGDKYLLGRGLVDASLSLSNEMRCREGVSLSAAPSDWLCEIGGARGTDDEKRGSNVEESSGPSELLWLGRGPMAERPTGEERRREGRAESLSELVS
jgi:hypothetical protein